MVVVRLCRQGTSVPQARDDGKRVRDVTNMNKLFVLSANRASLVSPTACYIRQTE